VRALLQEALSRIPVYEERWLHQDESGLTLGDFQVLYALAEESESLGRIEIVETQEETDTRKRLTVAVKIRRLK